MKVAIALDGSLQSEGALHLVRFLPVAAKEVTLIHVKPSLTFDPAVMPKEAEKEVASFNREIESKAAEIIKRAEKILASSGLKIKHALLSGSPAEQIIHYLDKQKIELLLMGARGLNPVQSFLLGSVADTVMRHAHCSILLYRGAPIPASREKVTIVLGFDDSTSSRNAIVHLKKWDAKGIAAVHLVAYAQMSFYYGMTYSLDVLGSWPLHKKTIEEALVKAEGELRKAHPSLKVTSEVLSVGQDVANELNAYAKKHHADVVVVGSKGKNLLDRIMLGSVSNKLAHHAEMPVLIVRS